MGVTGLLLCGFLVSHLLTNSLIYVSGDLYNSAAHAILSMPILYPAEAGLALLFFIHIAFAFRLTLENKMARPQNYYMKAKTGRGATLASSTMPYTGLVILIFLIWHLVAIKFGPHYSTTVDGVEMRDFYRLLVEYFADPLMVLGYVLSVICLGIHISHGFWSAFQSLGFNHPKYNCILRLLSKIYATVITLGFAGLPIFLYMQGGQL